MHSQIEMIRSGCGTGILDWLASACHDFGEQPAIEWRDTVVSYNRLDKLANQAANCLMANKISQSSIAAVMLDDRIDLIATLIGIFRAGAVFVPLDATLPEERLHRIVRHLSPDVFIIAEPYREKVERISSREKNCNVITLVGRGVSVTVDGLSPVASLEDFSAERPAIRIDPDAMRYIYYTSGSTGEPKGIAGRLAGLSHFIQWEIETFNIDVGWRISQFINPTFDAYFRDILLPLCTGGTVCIPPQSPGELETNGLIDWIDREKIDLIHCVPSLLRAVLTGTLDAETFRSLKYILLSGEVLQAADVKKWMEVFDNRIGLVNLYGATETTMVKFFHRVEKSDVSRGFIPIGKPLKGAKALVLDGQQRVCPAGVAGEIYIRTPFRTLGYYKDDDATKKVFVKNPFNDDPNDLIYRTGDLGLILNDGNFRFLGRKDNQVKIRGIRVELGEIENHLLHHPLVLAAVVLAHEAAPGDMRLFAYIVANRKPAPSSNELRVFLKQKVPDYMVPSAFVVLDALPLTPNGKVDRKALPMPDQRQPDSDDGFIAPRTEVEEAIATVWRDVLRVERLGIHENFFDLGGHSLLATQVISRMRNLFQLDLPLRLLFEKPTIEELGLTIEETLMDEVESQIGD
jgi:amino acid adenylation domain-containing protein